MEAHINPEPLATNKRNMITPFLWFNNRAEDAARFYASVFKNARVKTTTYYNEQSAAVSGMPKGTVMTVVFELEGQEFVALNGGPVFEISPAISFMVNCRTVDKINDLWEKLSAEGNIMMDIDQYPFSERYGWVEDKYGVSWQLILGNDNQIISPCLMFAGEQHGKAEEAINYYMSVFPNSAVERIERYDEHDEAPVGAVKYAAFSLNGQNFKAMDSGRPVDFRFTPGVSFSVSCENQQEIDFYWEKLTAGGDESYQQCGWLKDRYDVSWQVVPEALRYMVTDANSEATQRVMQALIPMKKLDVNVLAAAYENKEQSDDCGQIDFAETATNYKGMKKEHLSPNEEL